MGKMALEEKGIRKKIILSEGDGKINELGGKYVPLQLSIYQFISSNLGIFILPAGIFRTHLNIIFLILTTH